ncbi:MAG: hypothetical protein ACFFCQ_10580, partial [Promethearchaeota archaeon]
EETATSPPEQESASSPSEEETATSPPEQESASSPSEEETATSPPKYLLVEATDEGLVNAEFQGTGYCSGDSIEMKIESEVEFEIEVEIEVGWVLINSGSGQNMIIAEELIITLKPKVEIERRIEAYCLDIEKDNPSSQESFSLQIDTGIYGSEVVELLESLKTAPEERKSIEAVQIALWVLQDDVIDIPFSYSESDVLDAKWLLENVGIDVSGRRFFQMVGKSEEEIREMFEAEYDASATIVNMILTTEDWQITVTKMGMFANYDGTSYSEETFRVDLQVKNIGDETTYFSLYDSTLHTAQGLFDERSYSESWMGGDIVVGGIKEANLLFVDVPETAVIEELVIDDFYIFDFENDEAYTVMEMYENLYLQSAIIVEETITEGDFSITLLRVGDFTHLYYDTWGNEVTDFRVDLKVTNIVSQNEYLFRSDIVILDNHGIQYDSEYRGTLQLGEILSGETLEGYVLFPSLNENASQIKILITDTGYPEDVVYEFTVNL